MLYNIKNQQGRSTGPLTDHEVNIFFISLDVFPKPAASTEMNP